MWPNKPRTGRLSDKIAAVARQKEEVANADDGIIPERSGLEKVRAKRRDTFKEKKKVSSLYLPPTVHHAVREIAHAEDVKPHDIFMIALDEWLQRNGHGSFDEIMAKSDDQVA